MKYWILSLLFLLPGTAFPQIVESLDLIDCPTPGLLMSGGYEFDLTLEPNGGSIFTLRIGFLDRFLVGFSYGGTEIIGSGEPEWNPRVEFVAKARLVDELDYLPALTAGFDSQGHGKYSAQDARYEMKSKGFYLVAGKNLELLGRLGIHGGANYSLERSDQTGLNFLLGIEKDFSDQLSLIGEYDFALNDNLVDEKYGEGSGYLNCGFRWHIHEGFSIDFIFKNLNGNGADTKVKRGLKISYIGYL